MAHNKLQAKFQIPSSYNTRDLQILLMWKMIKRKKETRLVYNHAVLTLYICLMFQSIRNKFYAVQGNC